MKRFLFRHCGLTLSLATTAYVGMLAILPVAAELRWERNEIVQTVIPGDTEAMTEFRFMNAGRRHVRILAVRPSCDCASIGLTKMVYEAGEIGTIMLKMDLRSSRGTIDRTIDVFFDDGGETMLSLLWRVVIPDAVIIKPDTLVWRSGENETKVIGIARTGSEPIAVCKVECSIENFTWRLVTVKENDVYEIHITPRSDASWAEATIKILAGPRGREKWFERRANRRAP